MQVTGSARARTSSRQLRKAMTKPERMLWWALRSDTLGLRFRRSHAAGPYVLDFYCAPAALCVEIDGEQHDFRQAHDGERDAYLGRLGVRTLRIPARDVLDNLAGVVEIIRIALEPPPALWATSPRFPGEERAPPLPREPGGAVSEAD